MKAAICGDWHGNIHHATRMLGHLRNLEITEVIHCGDLGVWRPNDEYITSLTEDLRKHGMVLRFAPGNHENYDILDQLFASENHWLTSNIYALQRGEMFVIENTRFMGIGGAYSIDKEWRQPHVSWWPQELITYGQMQRILSTKSDIDVVIAHDCPISVDLKLETGYKGDEHTKANRTMLQVAIDHLNPSYVFHGHYHRRRDNTDHEGRPVIGLADDGAFPFQKNVVLFDCEARRPI